MATFTGTSGADLADATTGTLTGFTGGTVAELQDNVGDTFIGRPGTTTADGNDTVIAGSGDDNIRGLAGNDSINGGAGFDEVRYDRDSASGGTAGVTVNLATGTATDGFGNTDTLVSIELVRGTNAVDNLTGGNTANGIDLGILKTGFEGFRGLGGNDVINGGVGYDEVRHDRDTDNGGLASVVVNLSSSIQLGVASNTALDGFGNTDTLISIEGARGTSGADAFFGGAGDNSFTGLAGNDSFTGGDGFDSLRYDMNGTTTGVNVNLATGTATDGFGGTDTLSGFQQVSGTGFNDTMTGSNFVGYYGDTFIGFFGADIFNGGDGFDEVRYDNDRDYGGNGAVVVNLSTSVQLGVAAGTARDGFGTIDTLTNIEAARGTANADSFFGGILNNTFFGLAGNDTLNGGGGDGVDAASYHRDFLDGGTGAVIVNLSSITQFGIAAGTARDGFGNTDTLIDIEAARGTAGNDTLLGGAAERNVFVGLAGNDSMSGGAGSLDEVRYDTDFREGGAAGVTVNFATGTATDGFGNTDTISGFEGVRGTRQIDNFIGSDADEFFRGLAGNDVINGGNGSDWASYSHDIFNREESQTLSGVIVNLSAATQLGVASNRGLDGFGSTDTLSNIENASGGTLADRFFGSSGENSFRGLAGNDTIDGGAGFDIADYSEDARYGSIVFLNGSGGVTVNLAAGTATDGFGNADTLIGIEGVVGTDAGDALAGNNRNNGFLAGLGTNAVSGAGGFDLAKYNMASGAATLTRTGNGAWTISGAGFSDSLTGVEIAEFNDRTVALRERPGADFNGEGTSDMLLQAGGTVVNWLMQNGVYQSGNVITTGATGFTVVGKGDFDSDGDADILLQNGGVVVDWIMENGSYQSGNVITIGAAGFNVVGTGDFNVDGDADLLLQSGGTVVAWSMENGLYQSGSVITNGAAGFTVVGTGDFDGDADADILLQSGGTVVLWRMQDGAYQSGSVITTGATGFTVVGTGDLDGDGDSDIVLQSGGTVVDWIMQNGVFSSGNVITTGAGSFQVVDVGDYNNDAVADIALQSGGTVVNWIMQNGVFSSGNVITTGAVGFTVV